MYIISPQNNVFWDFRYKLHQMMNIYSKYDNMHKNGINYALK